MNRWKLAIALLLLVLGGFWLALRKTPSPTAEGPSPVAGRAQTPPARPGEKPSEKPEAQAFFVELSELNQDGFQETLFIADSPVQPPPFRWVEGKIVVAQGVQAAIDQGQEAAQYRLYLDKPGLNLKEGAKLFLIHQVRFSGTGRQGSFANYYVFGEYPAQLKLPVFDTTSDQLRLRVSDSVGQTLGIRLIPAASLDLSEKFGGQMEVSFAGKKTVLLAKGQELLSKLKHATSITQELFAPIPKGEVKEEDFRVVTEEFGKVDFFTELSLRNEGVCEVTFQEARPVELKPE